MRVIHLIQNQWKTKDSILEAGQQEFLRKGFRNASLRNIAKEAGVTTGAFYGYFKSKEELFAALVEEPAMILLNKYQETQAAFANLPQEEQVLHLGDVSGDCMDWMISFMYDHFAAFKLILCCAEGTEYENFIHTLVDIEIKATHQFTTVLQNLNYQCKPIHPQLEHILVSGMFSAFFELIIHDMPQEQAQEYVKEMRTFYTAGWFKILGL